MFRETKFDYLPKRETSEEDDDESDIEHVHMASEAMLQMLEEAVTQLKTPPCTN